MSEQPLMLRDDAALTCSFSPTAIQLRDAAIESSSLVGRVSNATENELAVAAQRELHGIKTMAEKARKAVKEPVIEFGRKIDNAAKEFTAELDKELIRVAKLIGDFQTLEQAKLRAAENARKEELSRIEKERQEALAKADSHDARDAVEEHFAARVAFEAPAIQPVRAAGQVVKTDWSITVTDFYKLAKYHPQCVSIEPKRYEIKQLLNQGITVQGVIAEKITTSTVRV